MLILAIQEFYPGFMGKELRSKLKEYINLGHKQLGYTRAREEMYGYIWNDPAENAIHCCYTDLKMDCAYESMSTQCNPAGELNCEHTVPQSLFNEKEPMKSDVYHLRASWSNVNSARSNYPFEYLSTSSVYKWYGNNHYVVDKIPTNYQDYSGVKKSTSFMPMDMQKGDTARAVAYFFTYYDSYMSVLSKTFVRVDDMIEWDMLYDPTQKQLLAAERAIEVYGNHNPFMEELGLVYRAFCDLSEGKYPCE